MMPSRSNNVSFADRRRTGFTLIELLVVIGIIVLLAGLTVSVSTAVVQRAEAHQTRRTLELLDMAMKEWEKAADRKLTWWQSPPDPAAVKDQYHVHSTTPEDLIISEMLEVIRHQQSVKDILAQIDPEFIYTYEEGTYPDWIDQSEEQSAVDERFIGAMTVLDAWGTPIYATHPGREWKSSDPIYLQPRDPDGTIQTYNEKKYGIAKSRSVCFVSAGPDRRWGNLELAGEERAPAEDNLYSYRPVIPPPPESP